MKRIWPHAVLGIAALLVFGLATLPAKVVLSRLAARGVQADGVSGSVWNGTAQILQVRGVNLGRVEWRLRALPLFLGRGSVEFKAVRPDGTLQAHLIASRSQMRFEDLNASFPLSALPPNTVPGGWLGMLHLRLSSLELTQGWPAAAAGTLEVRDATGPANRPINMGSYKVSFPGDTPPAANELIGALSDTGGPLQVSGTVHLKNDGTFIAAGLVAARSDAPDQIAKQLQVLGAPDGEGRRPFTIENKFARN
jgi:general secretion pathway protein N